MPQETRREFVGRLAPATASLAAFAAIGGRFQNAGKRPPNILYIMTDDHAAHSLSCYGSRINKTPNLDRIAREGMLFQNCFCTNSICVPSRASILTGKYSHANGALTNKDVFDGSQPTFPKMLQRAGFKTALIGKWHLKSEPTGFHYWSVLPGQGEYYNPKMTEMGQTRQTEGYVTDLITDSCIEWLKREKDAQPFCLLCHHKAPHRPWEPGPSQLSLYRDGPAPEPEDLFDNYETRGEAARSQAMEVAEDLRPRDLKLAAMKGLSKAQQELWDSFYAAENEAFRNRKPAGDELVRWKYQRYIKDYLRCVAGVDESVGRLLDFLDQAGLARDTVVIYTSDQGFFLGDHGWFDKRFMYEESLRMPLLIRYPREVKAGSVNSDMVLNVDFAPTFLDWAELPVSRDMHGRSVRPLLGGRTPSNWRKSMYYHYYEYPGAHSVKRHHGVRTERHKLIHFYDDPDAWELYDLRDDPGERNNVYRDPRYQAIVRKLKKELDRLQKQHGISAR